MSNPEGKELTTYIVLFQRIGGENVIVHETQTPLYHLLDANRLKDIVFQWPDVERCWVERMTQKRVGDILTKSGALPSRQPGKLIL